MPGLARVQDSGWFGAGTEFTSEARAVSKALLLRGSNLRSGTALLLHLDTKVLGGSWDLVRKGYRYPNWGCKQFYEKKP